MSIFRDQRDFMRACDQMFSEGLNVETSLWGTLIHEEYLELHKALQDFQTQPVLNHKAEVAKEAIDLIYVIAGLLNNLQVPADDVWLAVHDSNMSKVDPQTGKVLKRHDGKILKPEGWKKPDILKLLLEHHHANYKS
jgi:predicted HAD superfamily Cof-like phosphohydrolase